MFVPRLCFGRLVSPTSRLANTIVARNYCSRHVPVWRRRSLFDDLFDNRLPAWPARMLDRQIREMEQMMDKMLPSRWWVREPFYTKNTTKEVHVKYNDKVFEVKLDVNQFSPEEIAVKVTGNKLTVSAKHEQKQEDHGLISREFTRQFLVPEDVEVESLESLFTTDGHLVIRGQVREGEAANERILKVEKEKPVEPDKKEGN